MNVPDPELFGHDEEISPRIGTTGEVWRRMPYPVVDAVFDLEPPPDPGAVLVVGSEPVAAQLHANGAQAVVAERLTLEGLREAGVVVLLGGGGALPAESMAALAARRVLVADAGQATFGLQHGIEFLDAPSPEHAVERAGIARVYHDAMRPLRVMGARAAREHRASVIYPRLRQELRRLPAPAA
jgi:hypothetical protein